MWKLFFLSNFLPDLINIKNQKAFKSLFSRSYTLFVLFEILSILMEILFKFKLSNSWSYFKFSNSQSHFKILNSRSQFKFKLTKILDLISKFQILDLIPNFLIFKFAVSFEMKIFKSSISVQIQISEFSRPPLVDSAKGEIWWSWTRKIRGQPCGTISNRAKAEKPPLAPRKAIVVFGSAILLY